MSLSSKNYKDSKESLKDLNSALNIPDALGVLKDKFANLKFDETIEVSMNLGIDPRHADQAVRGVVQLPCGNGKEVKVAVFAKSDKAKEALDAGADIVGDDDLVLKVKNGEINFDKVISTPDMMSKVGTLGKILGPKGIMPNPKLGTVTVDVGNAVKLLKAGQVEYRAEKNGIVHAGVAKKSFTNEDILKNIKAFISAIISAKPSGAKGVYIKKVSLCSTMSPSIEIDISDLYEYIAS